MARRIPVLVLVLGCLPLLFPLAVQAQDAPSPAVTPFVVAHRLADGDVIRLDGVPDEPVWERAEPATDFLQRDPDNGALSTERTEVRILYDDHRLILGVTLHDSEPGRLLGNQMQRDQPFSADDRFMWTFDTFLDGRSGYFFEINPSGAMGDGLIDPGNTNRSLGAGINKSWDGIWTARVRRGASGWTAEVEVPFRTLNFDPDASAWGVNFQRTIRRKTEEAIWSGHERNLGLTRMANAGRLEGLRELSQGIGLDLKPYVVGTASSAPGRGRADRVTTGDVGADLFYNLTPALRANLSVNTDFAETEVDERQVNLTRFPLFFEEKRDFFLQGSSYFDFARDPGRAITPFFSRRIGLDERGVPQRIDVGAKLTGQAGAFDVGVLQARTADSGARAGEHFSVVRVRRRAFQESFLGAIYTRRAGDPRSPGDRHTVGFDTVLRTSTLGGSNTAELSAFYLWTSNPLGTGESSAYGWYARYPNDPFRANFAFRELQPHYSPAVGFLQRVGYRRWNPDAGYIWRPASHPWFREFDFQVDLTLITDLEGRSLTKEFNFLPFDVNFHDGSRIAVEVMRQYERLEEDFEISDGVILPVGREYSFTRYNFQASTANQRMVAVEGEITVGDFFSGRRDEYTASVRIRPRRGVAVALEAEHNTLTLAEGTFDTDVLRVVASTQVSPWISLANSLQYDSVSRAMGWQARFRWIQRPGNDLFLVYTHNWQERATTTGAARFDTLDTRLATKLLYTLRF